MSANEEKPELAGLYDYINIEAPLSPLKLSDHAKFKGYVNALTALSQKIRDQEESSPWKVLENGLRQIYKEMLYDAFKHFQIKIPEGMEVHFSGSLAKAQATEYSDLDAFVLLKNEEDMAVVKQVFDGLTYLCARIALEVNRLYPDPIGINPSRLIGTPDAVLEMLVEGMVLPVETACSILASKPIFPNYVLGEELRDKIRQNPDLSSSVSAKKFYDMAINDFHAPMENAKLINIKSHIMRPIDFILMGLREEFNLYSEDGSHLSALGTIRLLREQHLLPTEDIFCIKSVYNEAMQKRFDLHALHKEEHDEMDYEEAKEMLEKVASIRGLGVQGIARIEHKEKLKSELFELISSLNETADHGWFFSKIFSKKELNDLRVLKEKIGELSIPQGEGSVPQRIEEIISLVTQLSETHKKDLPVKQLNEKVMEFIDECKFKTPHQRQEWLKEGEEEIIIIPHNINQL